MARTNREFVMLADTFVETKHRSAGMYLSEKLDGMRCVWIPETKGMPIKHIPFANREKDRREHMASGLWSRYGKIIHCPDWFTEGFPAYPLDGELWMGRGKFQELMSTVKELEPDEHNWRDVQYYVFDAPRYKPLLGDGRINNGQWTKIFRLNDNLAAIGVTESHPYFNTSLYFDAIYKLLQRDLKATDYMRLHEQELLPFVTGAAIERINSRLEEVSFGGGEGLILRHPSSQWIPQRSDFLMKVKKLHDADGTIVGYKTGEVGKDGKFQGMLGSLHIRWQGNLFYLSGCIDASQRVLSPAAADWARAHPGELLPLSDFDNPCSYFPLGSVVTFRYTDLSNEGVPKNARFMRFHQGV